MLVTPNDMRKHRPIADNLDDQRRLVMYIAEAEKIDIIPVIGAQLYKDCSENPSNHELLLNGGYYNDNKKYFTGLKAAVCLLAYARFLPNNNINVTPFGIKEKIALDSNDVSDKSLFRQINEARNTGLAYLQQVVAYLHFSQGKCGKSEQTKKSKFKIIGK